MYPDLYILFRVANLKKKIIYLHVLCKRHPCWLLHWTLTTLLWHVNSVPVTALYFIYMNTFEVLLKFKLMYYSFVKNKVQE